MKFNQKDILKHLETLKVHQGDGLGKPWKVLPWQRTFVRKAFGGPVRDAALTMARGNGKSAFIGALLSWFMARPDEHHLRNCDITLAAASADQASIVMHACMRHLGLDPDSAVEKKGPWRYVRTPNAASLTRLESGVRLRVLGSRPGTQHGRVSALTICDEPAQWIKGGDACYAALRTGVGKIPGSRLVAIGTRAESPDHWFSRLLEDPSVYSQVHAAVEGAMVDDKVAWKAANPSWNALPTLRARVKAESVSALRDPSMEASFRALRLNLGESDVKQEYLIGADAWKELGEGEVERRGDFVLGLDLGGTAAMSAAAAYYPLGGAVRAVAAFPAVPSLTVRAKRDGAGERYTRAYSEGSLLLHEGRTTSPAELLRTVKARWGVPRLVVADRWREGELKDALAELGWRPEVALRGMGFRDGAEDVRAFRRAVLEGRVHAPVSILIRSSLAAARTQADPAGNAKLVKAHAGARDDVAVAMVLAVAAGERARSRTERQGGGRVRLL